MFKNILCTLCVFLNYNMCFLLLPEKDSGIPAKNMDRTATGNATKIPGKKEQKPRPEAGQKNLAQDCLKISTKFRQRFRQRPISGQEIEESWQRIVQPLSSRCTKKRVKIGQKKQFRQKNKGFDNGSTTLFFAKYLIFNILIFPLSKIYYFLQTTYAGEKI